MESRYGKLIVISEVYKVLRGDRNRRFIDVQCDCGSIKPVSYTDLIQNKIKSCGVCIRVERSTTHGMSGTRPFSIWHGMKRRCTEIKLRAYPNYGGRGISFDPKWESFEGFWEDMEDGYSETLELDRIDVDGNYCKENCRWASFTVQAHNRRKRKDSGCSSIGVVKRSDSKSDKYRTTLHKQGVKIFDKTFDTELEAATTYDNYSEEIYGDRPNKTIRDSLP